MIQDMLRHMDFKLMLDILEYVDVNYTRYFGLCGRKLHKIFWDCLDSKLTRYLRVCGCKLHKIFSECVDVNYTRYFESVWL